MQFFVVEFVIVRSQDSIIDYVLPSVLLVIVKQKSMSFVISDYSKVKSRKRTAEEWKLSFYESFKIPRNHCSCFSCNKGHRDAGF